MQKTQYKMMMINIGQGYIIISRYKTFHSSFQQSFPFPLDFNIYTYIY